MAEFRIERDSIGEREIPADAYYGINTLRASENFDFSGRMMYPEQIISLAEIKKATAIANFEAGVMEEDVKNAIVQAADELIDGKFHDQFIVDQIQGGAGTSGNMNVNEVIANRGNEILGGELGVYDKVNPNDHVNYGQSTNDVFPTSGKLAALKLGDVLLEELDELYDSLMKKSEEFDDVIKMGRTHIQDAVPIRLGQEFHAYATTIKRNRERIAYTLEELKTVNMGASAVGTGINVDVKYLELIVPTLSEVTGLELKQAEDLVDGTHSLDSFVAVSSVLKTLSVSLSKISNDLRLMSSGPRTGFGEITLPSMQAGSSIMPGKINPVIAEVMSQVSFNVIGNDMAVTMAAEAGQLELNVFEPVLFYNLFESISMLSSGVRTLRTKCIDGIVANRERCTQLVEGSVGIITAIVPHVGYKAASEIAKEAITTGAPVRDLALEKGLLTEDELNEILVPFALSEPGIAARHFLDEKDNK